MAIHLVEDGELVEITRARFDRGAEQGTQTGHVGGPCLVYV